MSKYEKRRTVRLDDETDAAMQALAAKQGEDLSDFIRTAIKHAVMDYRAPCRADLIQFNHLCRVLDGAATNLNQLARAANQARLGQGSMPEVQAISKAADTIGKLGYEVVRIIRFWI